jgi:hypothetical protein
MMITAAIFFIEKSVRRFIRFLPSLFIFQDLIVKFHMAAKHRLEAVFRLDFGPVIQLRPEPNKKTGF